MQEVLHLHCSVTAIVSSNAHTFWSFPLNTLLEMLLIHSIRPCVSTLTELDSCTIFRTV